MSTESLLATMLQYDRFSNEDPKVSGIAQRAVSNGFNSLTPKQKAVLHPLLTQHCDGATDPGGYHNDCRSILEGDEYKNAIINDMHYGALLCQSCMDESDDYANRLDSLMRE